MLLGLRTVIYKVPDLGAAKAWYTSLLGVAPYFDEPFYVGFNVGGFELGLDPDVSERGAGPGGALAYWGVENLRELLQRLSAQGVTPVSALQEVGGGILVAAVEDPYGNHVGLIENPHFSLKS